MRFAFNLPDSLSGGPVFISGGWMDSGPAYYFSVAPVWLILVALLFLFASLLVARCYKLALVGLIWIGLFQFGGFYLEMFGYPLAAVYAAMAITVLAGQGGKAISAQVRH